MPDHTTKGSRARAFESRVARPSSTLGRRSRERLGGRIYDSVVQSPQHKKKRQGLFARLGIRAYHAGGAAALALLVAAICAAFVSPDFYVWDAQIRGCRWLSEADVMHAAGLEGQSIFYIDPLEVSAALQSLPVVADVHVVCRLPNRVSIQITEREPAAIWQAQEDQYWVDQSGVLFPRYAGLPNPVIIVEQEAQQSPRGAGDQVDAAAVTTALEWHSWLPDVYVFGYERGRGLTFDLAGGPRVLMPVHGNVRKLASSLATLRRYLAEQRMEASLIDLRYENRGIWR